MSRQGDSPRDVGLGATFIPGGPDDYYMPAAPPELVSPAPQRIMPEVPENIQENLAHLELEANNPKETAPTLLPTGQHNEDRFQNGQVLTNSRPLPSFSPFPKLRSRPPNVPQADNEKEQTLENARILVLNSNDPAMQLVWAQDALSYVEIAMKCERRILGDQPRPPTPQVQHQLRIDAMNIVSFLAEQHHPLAEFIRGMWLEFGKLGMRMDKTEAFWCYTRSADRGYARADYRIGHQYEMSHDIPNALRHYNKGLEAGDSASTYRLGMMTLLGQHGQRQDHGKGIQLIGQAAETADDNAPQAAYVYGMLLARELPTIGLPEEYLHYDENRARSNIEKAAFHGFAKAQVRMGSAYELCSLGCDFNPALSLHYNALAARRGEAEAEMAISKWFLCGYDGLFPRNEELAYIYGERAATSGLPTAQFAMGYYHEIGMYCSVNMEKALEWYKKAARAGNPDAPGRIEEISKAHLLSKKDHESIAISRIRSQYGSQKGKRPERFKAQTPRLPTIADTPPGNPDSSRPQARTTQQSSRHSAEAHVPQRSGTTPYPMENRPATTMPYTVTDRPASVAPYPLEDGPPGAVLQRPTPAGGFLAASTSSVPTLSAARPVSALAVNTGVHSFAGQATQAAALTPQRPQSTIADVRTGLARMPATQRIVSGGPVGQNYRQPGGPSLERPGSDRLEAALSTPRPPPIDIGYSAPFDPRLEMRNKLRKASENRKAAPDATSKPLPNPHTSTNAAPARLSQDGQQRQSPTRGRIVDRRQSPARNSRDSSGGWPPRQDSKPPTPAPVLPQAAVAPAPSARPPRTEHAVAAKPVPHPDAAPPKPQGQGPKTFEEMGVPAAPPKGDCVVM